LRSRRRRARCARGAGRRSTEATPESFFSAIRACAESGQADEALDLLEQMVSAGVPVDVACYNEVLRAFVAGGQLELALSLFESMPQVGLAPDAAAYSLVLAACERAGLWQQALHHLESMRAAGLRPDEQAFASAVGACASGGQWQWAVHVVTDMQEQGLVPTEATFGAAIAVCTERGQVEWADALAVKMYRAGAAEALVGAGQGRAWVDRVAGLQRYGTDLEKTRWGVYCDVYGGRQRDPAAHDDAFLERFFEMLDAWPTDAGMDAEGAESHEVLAMRVLEMQAVASSAQKFRWERFCALRSASLRDERNDRLRRDPMLHHDAQSLREYLELEAAAAAAVPEAAEEEEPSQPRGVQEICNELAKLREAAVLFEEAVRAGVFSYRWRDGAGRKDTRVDLHMLNKDLAKLAVYVALSELLLLPPGSDRLNYSMRIMVGKGLHSHGGVKVTGPLVHRFLKESFLFKLAPLDNASDVITIGTKEIRRVHAMHPFWVSERSWRLAAKRHRALLQDAAH